MSECGVDGCDRKRYARQEVCEPHYRRFRRTGSYGDTAIGTRRPPQMCTAAGCRRRTTEKGLCHAHYLRLLRSGSVQEGRPLTSRARRECSVETCERPAVVRRLCRTHANRQRKFGDVQADKPIREVAGRGFVNHGYWVVPVPPELRHLTDGVSPYPEHRLVMAQLLGRPLTRNESVHHINGNRRDNRVDGPLRSYRSGNLELWSNSQPSGQRVSDKLAHAIEILELYLPEALVRQLPLLLADTGFDLDDQDGRLSDGNTVAPMGFEPTLPP